MAHVTLYTDGAASGNPGPGGYGVLLQYGPYEKEISQGYRLTTNNRMELLAVIVGLEALTKEGLEVHVFSDSKYVVDAINKGWVRKWRKVGYKDKKNPDLWERLLKVHDRHRVTFHWVRGHNGDPRNERVDALAVDAYRRGRLLVDAAYESTAS